MDVPVCFCVIIQVEYDKTRRVLYIIIIFLEALEIVCRMTVFFSLTYLVSNWVLRCCQLHGATVEEVEYYVPDPLFPRHLVVQKNAVPHEPVTACQSGLAFPICLKTFFSGGGGGWWQNVVVVFHEALCFRYLSFSTLYHKPLG